MLSHWGHWSDMSSGCYSGSSTEEHARKVKEQEEEYSRKLEVSTCHMRM